MGFGFEGLGVGFLAIKAISSARLAFSFVAARYAEACARVENNISVGLAHPVTRLEKFSVVMPGILLHKVAAP